MAKSQKRSNRELKKPKQEKAKTPAAATISSIASTKRPPAPQGKKK